jgi:type IV pilus assembly protein PilB
MKVPDFLLTAAINLIMAQRLARRLCDKCHVPQPISIDAQKQLQEAFAFFEPYEGFDMATLNEPIFYGPNKEGCNECQGKGYKGRVGLYEVLAFSDTLKKSILDGTPSFELNKMAQKEGMVTLEQDGLIKAAQGLTSLEEVYKLVK